MKNSNNQQYDIVFALNNTEEIRAELEKPLDTLDCCHEVPIVLYENKKKSLLSVEYLQWNMEIVNELLTKALKNELPLHESITQNIGYLYNKDLTYLDNKKSFNRSSLIHTEIGEIEEWVGYKHELLSSYELSTWLYNDASGDIVLEVTPIYPGRFIDPAKEKIPSYDLWIQTYKPYFMRIIPKKVAQKWLVQARAILKQIELNINNWLKEKRPKNYLLHKRTQKIHGTDDKKLVHNYKGPHCCLPMDTELKSNDTIVVYNEKYRKYGFKTPHSSGSRPMSYCIFCGEKFPQSLYDEWSALLLDEYGIEAFSIVGMRRIPREFRTDEWWKKRGL